MVQHSLDSGIVSPSENSRNRYLSVSLCDSFKVSKVNEMPGETHQEERLHLVLVPHRHFVNVNDGSIPTAWNAAVRLNRTEYLPSTITIALISGETERDEQRLDCFRPVRVPLAHSQGVGEEVSRRTGACIVRHRGGIFRPCGHAVTVMSNQNMSRCRNGGVHTQLL